MRLLVQKSGVWPREHQSSKNNKIQQWYKEHDQRNELQKFTQVIEIPTVLPSQKTQQFPEINSSLLCQCTSGNAFLHPSFSAVNTGVLDCDCTVNLKWMVFASKQNQTSDIRATSAKAPFLRIKCDTWIHLCSHLCTNEGTTSNNFNRKNRPNKLKEAKFCSIYTLFTIPQSSFHL